MNTEWVLDASVLAKCLFAEAGSDEALRFVATTPRLIAPDFIFVELASIAAKKVRRGDVDPAFAGEALVRSEAIPSDVTPCQPLTSTAFELACKHGTSVYDGLYLALAMARRTCVVTADLRLVGRCGRSGLQHLVRGL